MSLEKRTPPKRKRIVTWEDPKINSQAIRTMSGMDYLKAMRQEKLPPMPVMMLMGYSLVKIEPGHSVFELEPAEYHYNPNGMVHGGILSAILDSTMGSAVRSKLPLGVNYVTVEFKVNFIRAVTNKTGRLKCEGHVINLGGRIAIAEGKVTDQNDRLYACATTTCLIIKNLKAGKRKGKKEMMG